MKPVRLTPKILRRMAEILRAAVDRNWTPQELDAAISGAVDSLAPRLDRGVNEEISRCLS